MTASEPRILLVAERFNQTRWRQTLHRPYTTDWFRVQLRFGALRGNPRLATAGVRWHDAMNLLEPDPQSVPWDRRAARECAATATEKVIPRYDHVWLVGRRVAIAFGLARLPFLGSHGKYHLLPHPSGLNHWWNDPLNEDELWLFVREVQPECDAPVGGPLPSVRSR